MRSDQKSMITVHYMPPRAKKSCYTFMMHGNNILTTVTADPDEVAEWIKSVEEPELYWPPQYYAFEIEVDLKTNRIGTLQLCGQNACLVFQLPDAHSPPCLPRSLIKFLKTSDNRFVSPDIVSKVGLLRTQFPFRRKVKVEEMGDDCGPFVRDLKRRVLMANPIVGMETDWDRLPRRLSTDQVHYATLNAYLNIRLWNPDIHSIPKFYIPLR